jgi:hypothetical protein
MKLKPSIISSKLYHRKAHPPECGRPPYASREVKHGVTSGLALLDTIALSLRFLKTDWAPMGSGAILQPDDSPASVAATKRLADEICDFDLTIKGARLRPVRFDSQMHRAERHFHSFVGEAACGPLGYL